MIVNLLLFWAGLSTLAFSIAAILCRKARREARSNYENYKSVSISSDNRMHEQSRQLEVRHDAIKKLLTNYYTPETMAFFSHLVAPSSHIPDNIFEKVDAHQDFSSKKKKEE